MTNPANAASREARAAEVMAEAAGVGSWAKMPEKACVGWGETTGRAYWRRMAKVAMLALADEAASQPRDDANGRTSGWKCNCCQTVFTSQQQARRPDDNNGGPRCPYCKADGQYTYPYRLHDGDPCAGCGVAHDDVVTGPCCALHDTAPTDQAQATVSEMEKIATDQAQRGEGQ